ncbi:MAG: response regulator, partial [Chloroflexi bacterium]|nr:response regulator [Chloroflexota bacterium]
MKHVLIVGGEDIGKLTQLMLKRLTGDSTTLVPTVEQALALCQSEPPDLVVMSWTTVDMTWSDEFTARLRALPNGQTIPLILISAYSAPDFIRRIFDCGGPTEFITAPWSPQKLLAAHQRLL